MRKCILHAALAAVALSGVAHAAPILPGTGILMAGDVSPLPTSSVVDTHTSNLSQGGVSATLRADVYANDATNSLGGLTFVYTLTNGASSDALERVNFDGYSGTTIDVDYLPGSAAPSTASLSTLTQDGGDLLGFNFQDAFGEPDLLAGQQAVLIVHTNANTEVADDSHVIDNAAISTTALAPEVGTIITPEPASLGILSVLGTMLIRKRRN
jgi:hypothetical protein